MAIQALNTIKNWFRTSLKPTQEQFWDTWDSFRHKEEKIDVEDVEGIEDLLADAIPQIYGTPNSISKFNSSGNGLENSFISDDGNKILINKQLEIDSKLPEISGLKFTNLKNDDSVVGPIDIITNITGSTNGTAIDSKDNIYIYQELGGTSIYKINSFTNAVTIAATLPSRVDGIKVANSDNIYFTYYTNEGGNKTSIGRISPDGTVSDVALNIDGYFNKIALDTNTEDIYLTTYDTIIKITSSGVISNFVPSLSIGSVNCMAVDYNHNLILALSNAAILKVEPDGTQSILTTLNAPSSPRSMIIDKDNTIYTANYYSNDIAVIYQTGETNYIGSIGEYNAEIAMDNDGNFLTVAHNARKLYLTTPDGVSIILGDTAEFPRLPVVNSKNEIFVSNYNAGLQKYILSRNKNKLLTVDKEGNVILSDKEVTIKSDFKTINGESILGSGNIEILNNTIPVSATVTGLVNNTALQELGGQDKLINGVRIGQGATSGVSNTALGVNVLSANTTGSDNTGVGSNVLELNKVGESNTALGSYALHANTGSYNDALGCSALGKNTTAIANTAVGSFSLAENLTSPYNVAIGCTALSKMASGLGQSTAIGAFCMSDATSTDKNAAIGTYALRYNTSGFSNTAIGHTALGLNTSGNSNNAVGNYSLGAVTTGAANIGIGKFAGKYVTTGNSNIYIGSEGIVADATASNIINIGNKFIAKGTKISLVGTLNLGTTPVYENNTTALAGGLTTGDVYRTSTGVLMIAY